MSQEANKLNIISLRNYFPLWSEGQGDLLVKKAALLRSFVCAFKCQQKAVSRLRNDVWLTLVMHNHHATGSLVSDYLAIASNSSPSRKFQRINCTYKLTVFSLVLYRRIRFIVHGGDRFLEKVI